ncbi:MAG: RNA polymerase sigma factor [Saprospiraceae bacterium]|nr:RNA polymerase sigma factor [Saprospiraceae bacterium]
MAQEKAHTESDLINGCIRNKRVFQEAMYRKYFDSMMRMCLRYTTDTEIAMTVCNDGFLKVFKKINTFASKGSLEGWIRRIVYHALSDYFKREAKYIQFMVFEDHEDQQNPEIVPGLYADDLMSLIDKIPEMSARVFRLYAIEGYNHREIGERLGMSDNTSKWHLSNARKKLKELIELQNKEYVHRKG